MNRKIVLMAALVLMFLAIFATHAVASVRAETGTTLPEELLFEESSFPKWFVNENGTVFQITNSSYLNVTLTSSEYVHVHLESVPRVVSYGIESFSATSTILTLLGLVPSTTYYRHQDGYLVEEFTTNSNGEYTYIQDVSKPHHVFIQTYASTLYISSDYTFSGDIDETIVVAADNIVIDGNGYTLQGSDESSYGFYLMSRSNITIRNVIVKKWYCAIKLGSCSSITIYGSTITNNNMGISQMWGGHNSTFYGNTVTDHFQDGIVLYSNNTAYGNTLARNGRGITLEYDGSTVYGNNITDSNWMGIEVLLSNNNIIYGNTVTNTQSRGYAAIFCIEANNNTIYRNTIANNSGRGIIFLGDDNAVYGNIIANNYRHGILFQGNGNAVYGNIIANNFAYGIYIYPSSDNTIYHNNIVNNAIQAYDTDPSANYWHSPDLLEGNYWSDYPGTDDGSGTGKHAIAGDGIGDTHIPWPGPNYDYYPFVHESGWEAPPSQHYLTLNTSPPGVTIPTGEGWYNAGTYASITTDEYIYITSTIRYQFNGWTTADMTEITNPASTSTTVLMDKDKTVTANYVLQYLVTFSQTGLDSSSVGTVVTVNGSTKTYSDLPFSMWVDSGTTISYNYEATILSNTSGKKFILDSITGPTSPVTVMDATTVTGNYETQYYLTIISPYDTPGGEGWYNEDETAYAILNIGLDYVNGLAYGFTGWSGDASGWDLISDPITMNAPKTAIANWEESPLYGDVRTIGFWKHQINVWYFTELAKTGMKIKGIGTAQISQDESIAFLTFIDQNSDYFNGKIVGTTNLDTLRNAYNILKTPTGPDSMKMRAEQQLLAVWLNLAYKAFFWNTQLSQDTLYIYCQYNFENEWGLTSIGEAIKFAEAELLKPDGNFEAVKNICDSINNNQGIIWGT